MCWGTKKHVGTSYEKMELFYWFSDDFIEQKSSFLHQRKESQKSI